MIRLIAIVFAWALTSCAHAAELSLPAVFSDHMVLQRGQPVTVWGSAQSGEKVELQFGGTRSEARASADGQWRITLPAMKAGGPFELTVRSGPHAKTISDVFVGEVWLAAGQSNMAFRFRLSDPSDQEAALRSLRERNVRAFAVAKVVSGAKLLHQEDGPWRVAGVDSVADWSAVGVYFSEALRLEKDVAIGIIDVSQGSSTIEAWMSEPALAEARAAGYVPKKPYEDIRRHYRNPTVLHGSMLTKVVPYTIRGVLWYQGESNADDAASYELLLPALIGSWRALWDRPDLPFLFAQLPAYEQPDDKTKQSWVLLRAAQAKVQAAVPGTGMAVLIDSGDKDNLHPTDKSVVGQRLARLARALVYGEDIVYSGPVVKKIEYTKEQAVIHFDQAEGGLVAASRVEGFEARGRDGVWRAVVPRIDGDRLIVRLSQGDEITGVRHAWANAPHVNLRNKAGLPAAPFSVERPAASSRVPAPSPRPSPTRGEGDPPLSLWERGWG